MSDDPKLKVVHPPAEPIPQPGKFSLGKFKSTQTASSAGVETLLTALPHYSIADAKDFVRLHPNEDEYWSPELCFVSVPIKGQKHDTLHLIDEGLAKLYLPSARVQRFRLALATKPNDVFFLCHVPSRGLDNSWNASNLQACEQAKTLWTTATSQKAEGIEAYKVGQARDPDAFPAPNWLTQLLETLIGVTFTGCLIEVADNPALLRLIGGSRVLCDTLGRRHFQQVVVVDFEYEIEAGGLPNVLCMVAYVLNANLQQVRTIKLWRGEFCRTPPFDTGPDALFVAYSAWAEMTCFLQLGWPFPVHILDLHTAYLSVSNILLPYDPDEEKKRKKPRKRLPDACRAYGIEGWERVDKDSIAADIGAGNWRKYGREVVLDYCAEDDSNSAELLRRMLHGYAGFPPIDVPRVLHWSNYSAKCIARIQARGIPIDTALWNLVQENKRAVIGELLRRFDPSHGSEDPIYTTEGEFAYTRFERWLPSAGIPAWPRLESGALDISGDAFRIMYHQPGIENLHALRDSVGFIAKARLPIGPDGRNRPSLFPFGTATGRNAHAKSPYNAHAGVRGFIQFSPDTVGAYLDWRTQEVGVAAVRSGDEALMADYRGGDVYHALARLCGLTDDPDPKHWKIHNPDQRQRMKPLQLAINYGMGVPSLAKGLNRHPLIASNIIELHRRTYPRFWQWRDDMVTTAMLERRIESSHGWPLRITSSPNKRMLFNYPMQSGGAEMLRHATWKLCEAGIVPVMLVHDGILFELESREQVEHAKEIMRVAGREICDGFEIGVDEYQILLGGARYSDKRDVAKKMWATIMSALEAVRAIPRRA